MSNAFCPLSLAAISHPEQLILDGEASLTYQQMDRYAEELSVHLNTFPKHSIFATKVDDPSFFIALLFACLRGEHILFPIGSKLPSPFIKSKLIEVKVALFFEKSIPREDFNTPSIKHKINPSIPFTYLLTSGSTSSPKICVHSFDNHFYSAKGSNTHLSYKEGDRWLLSLPLNHVSGLSLIFRTVLAQATLVLPKNSLEESINQDKLTHISVVPTQLQRLITSKSLQNLRCILLGGAPIPTKLLEKAKSLNLPICSTYGLTEMSSQVVTDDMKTKEPTLLPFREVKIGINQEVLVRGKCLFLGYFEKDKLVKPLDIHGWYATGDRAEYTEGRFIYLGRRDNLFVSGGENIQPEEIEALLLRHPDIEEALVLPKPDEEFGHRPMALVKSNTPINPDSLNSYLSKYLPNYKLPIGYMPLHYSGLKPSREKLSNLHFLSNSYEL